MTFSHNILGLTQNEIMKIKNIVVISWSVAFFAQKDASKNDRPGQTPGIKIRSLEKSRKVRTFTRPFDPSILK